VITQNAIAAYLGWRQDHFGNFTRVQMFDDGAHGDGSAGDGVFGVSILAGYNNLEYFVYAENTQQGKFLPARAEFEYFTIPLSNSTGEILINEVMAKNASFADPDGEFDDWVELYNPNDYAVNIGGMYMTDNHYSNGITAWTQIPTGSPDVTTIPPHGYLLVWFDEDLDQGPLHVNDKLGGAADAVYLISSDGATIIDTYSWTESNGLDVDDVSIGRYPDGSQNWQLFGAGQTNPSTPGTANQGVANFPPSISNIAYDPNPALPAETITVTAMVGDSDGNLTSVELLWGLSDVNENTVVMNGQASLYHAIVGSHPTNTTIRFRIRATDSFGAVTNTPIYQILVGYVPLSNLKINEVMATNTITVMDDNGDYEDWIEIFNPYNHEIDLAGYYLVDNHFGDFSFTPTQIPYGVADQTSIPARGFKLIWFDEQPEQGPLHIDT